MVHPLSGGDAVASEQRFRRLAESLGDVVATYDADWTHTWVSPSVRRVLGWEPADLVGRPARDLLHPDDRDGEVALGGRLAHEHRPAAPHRTRMLRKDGSYCWVEHTLSFTYSPDGRHESTSIVIRDVDRQVATEQALQESQSLFTTMFRTHHAIMLLLDARTGAIVDANNAAAAFYGYDVATLRRMSLRDIDPRTEEEVVPLLAQATARVHNIFLAPNRLADGSIRTVEVHSSPLVEQGRTLLFSIHRDVTDDLDAHAALEASEDRLRSLVESMTDVMATFGPDGLCTWLSPSMRRMLGRDPGSLLGTRVLPLIVHPDDLQPVMAALLAGIAAGRTAVEPLRCRLRHMDGSYRWVEAVSSFRYQDGVLRETHTVVRDVDAQVRAEEQLRESQEHYRLLAEHSGDAVLRLDAHGVILWASPAVTRLNGFRAEDLVGVTALDLSHPDGLDAGKAARAEVVAGGVGSFRTRTRCADGSWRWIDVVSRGVMDPDTGALVGIVTNWRDAERDVAAQRELAASEERFRVAMASAPVPMMLVALDGHIMEANAALTGMLGYGHEELAAMTLGDLLPADGPGLAELPLESLQRNDHARVAEELRVHTRDGATRWGQLSVTLVRGEDGTPAHYIAQLLDVTDVRAAREQLAHQALHDPLTGLANRGLFEEELQRAFGRARRRGRGLAVLFCDLDGFKQINDEHGHDVGDSLLVEVARRLKDSVRASDVVARLGGDEFVIVAEDLRYPDEVVRMAERILRNMGEPVALADGRLLTTATSIGVALAGADDEPHEVVHRADKALYAAKAAGRNRWALHPVSPSLEGGCR